MENRKGVILQGHLDMVPQKNEDTDHDFEKDPIQAYVDGEWVRAKGCLLYTSRCVYETASLSLRYFIQTIWAPSYTQTLR